MNAQALTVLADATEAYVSDYEEVVDRKDIATAKRAISDARRETEAASGYGTEATLMWSICVDNDRETFDTIRAMVAEHAGGETAHADLADALKDWTENTCGTEGVALGPDRVVYGDEQAGPLDASLSLLMLTLIRSAIVAIDWHRLAVVLLDEHNEHKEADKLAGMDQVQVRQFAERVIGEDYADVNVLREFLRENGLTPEEIDD